MFRPRLRRFAACSLLMTPERSALSVFTWVTCDSTSTTWVTAPSFFFYGEVVRSRFETGKDEASSAVGLDLPFAGGCRVGEGEAGAGYGGIRGVLDGACDRAGDDLSLRCQGRAQSSITFHGLRAVYIVLRKI
jgi:hypothetical protein